MDSEDFNKTIFNSLVWEELEKIPDDRILREFVTIAKNAIINYESGGGSFPATEYLIGLAKDNVREKERKKQEDREKELQDPKKLRELVRESWIKKYQ